MAQKQNGGQRLLCMLLHKALNGGKLSEEERREAASADFGELLRVAEKHSVLPLLYDVLTENDLLNEADRTKVQSVSQKTVRQSYRLLFLTKYLVSLLENAGIPTAVLKGCSVAANYPVPELRKSGDVDLLIRESDAERAVVALEGAGYRVLERQLANHHIVCCGTEGIAVELHVMMAEPFEDARINRTMKRLSEQFAKQLVRRECMGVEFPVLPEAWQAFQLMLHMLQHFLRAGFGLKLLCDWVVFWNWQRKVQVGDGAKEDDTEVSCGEEPCGESGNVACSGASCGESEKVGCGEGKSRGSSEDVWCEFLQLAEECGLERFACAVTDCCVEFLGLSADFADRKTDRQMAEAFLCDVMEAEEFGHSDKKRMVALQGKGLPAYWKEFHHQMKLNHPKASRCVLLWPLLWVVTLFVFLRNNRKLKRGSTREILKSAAARGELARQLGLDGKKGEKHAGN